MELIKNKKGNLMFAFISGAMIFICGLVLMNFILPEVDTARILLNCSNSTVLSSGNKITCIGIDGTVPYLILIIFSVTGGIILDKIIT